VPISQSLQRAKAQLRGQYVETEAFHAGYSQGCVNLVAVAGGYRGRRLCGGKSGSPRVACCWVKTPSLDHDGFVLFDLQAQEKNGLRLAGHRVRIRLNIAGTAPVGSVDYDWIRFIRRQDEARVAANPRIRDIVTEP
jgi:hypothetical protein